MLWFLGLNSFGLILDIAGVVLLFFFGLPVEGVSKFGGQQINMAIWGRTRTPESRALQASSTVVEGCTGMPCIGIRSSIAY